MPVSKEVETQAVRPRPLSEISANHLVWDVIAKLIAPAGLVVSAASYVAGYIRRMIIFREFGYSPSLSTDSLQETIARGFLLLIPCIAIMFVVVMTTRNLVINKSKNALTVWHRLVDYKSGNRNARDIAYMFIGQIFAICLAFTGVVGLFTGNLAIYKINRDIADCKNSCLKFYIRSGHLYGVLLDQSKEHTILVARDRTYIMPTSAVLGTAHAPTSGW